MSSTRRSSNYALKLTRRFLLRKKYDKHKILGLKSSLKCFHSCFNTASLLIVIESPNSDMILTLSSVHITLQFSINSDKGYSGASK